MNAAQRKAIVKQLTELLAAHGVTNVAVEDDPRYRSTAFHAILPGVRFGIDIDSTTPPVGSWFMAERRLSPDVFGRTAVNPFHGTKATTVATSWDAFVPEFERLCKAVLDGSAFEANTLGVDA